MSLVPNWGSIWPRNLILTRTGVVVSVSDVEAMIKGTFFQVYMTRFTGTGLLVLLP